MPNSKELSLEMTFGFLVGSRNFIRFFWVCWEVFVSHRYDCIHCVAKVLYHHGKSMIVPRFTFLTKNFVIRCDQVTKMFRSGHDCTSTSSARSPCYFRLQANITMWVLRKVRLFTVLTRTRVPLLLAAPLEVHEMTWKCLDFLALGLPTALLKYFHEPNSL